VKDPESRLKALGLEFLDPVQITRPAKLDSTYRAWIGQDAFYLSSHDTREHFLHDPLKYCAALTDPVTQARFHPTSASPKLTYHGRAYYFASDSTRAVFRSKPDFYAVRGPMDEAHPMMMPESHSGH
jgi:YHS domain-containing protein